VDRPGKRSSLPHVRNIMEHKTANLITFAGITTAVGLLLIKVTGTTRPGLKIRFFTNVHTRLRECDVAYARPLVWSNFLRTYDLNKILRVLKATLF